MNADYKKLLGDLITDAKFVQICKRGHLPDLITLTKLTEGKPERIQALLDAVENRVEKGNLRDLDLLIANMLDIEGISYDNYLNLTSHLLDMGYLAEKLLSYMTKYVATMGSKEFITVLTSFTSQSEVLRVSMIKKMLETVGLDNFIYQQKGIRKQWMTSTK